MQFLRRVLLTTIVWGLLIPGILPSHQVQGATLSSYQSFNQNLSKELKKYIKKSGGTITLHYREFSTGDEFKMNSTSAKKAASTIKLPLALYVMELAAEKKINLNEKLTYKRHHYYGGSGVIQKKKFGSKYTIRDLVKKAMIHSDNIAFIMLRERVGKKNFIAYMKRIGGKNAYPKGQNLTSASDLIVYTNRLYNFSTTNALGKELVSYLKKTDYNTTIPKGIKGVSTAHKVGMIPASRIYNDVGIVYDKNPFALAVMTNNLSYTKSQKVIADISSIVYKHHKEKNNVHYFKTKKATPVHLIPVSTTKNIGSLARGQVFKIISVKGEWYEILYGGKKGYVRKNTLTAYTRPPASGFVNRSIKNNGWISAKYYTQVLDKPDPSGKVLMSLYKKTSIYAESISGNYYKTIIGNRVGYVSKDSVQLLYTANVKHFEIVKEDARIYFLRNGIYVHMGELKKGQIFTRTKDAGAFNEVQIGNIKAYVHKSDTNPLFSATIVYPISSNDVTGEVNFNLVQKVYSKPSAIEADIIGSLNYSQKVGFLRVIDGWYEINFLGRKGYIQIENHQ
ncbi:serine hydrolase [Bacillus sp. ISL-35]|uniref:serine hydrolase n=1 Tax=Bacillus sp. ISL-35 TaxID=2819122 RepID=UPI001BE7E2CA|nr:serine hydrolase [Bacillus sp. ISL-35]MBT2703795.1 serine hydrolase [Chryseobacterium sp. ISL-80]